MEQSDGGAGPTGRLVARGATVALGFVLVIGVASGADRSDRDPDAGTSATVAAAPTPVAAPISDDPRVAAFYDAYEPLIDSVSGVGEDVVFHFERRPIHFLDGRMLADGSLENPDDCDPIFYRYPISPLTEVPPPPPDELPTYCSDLLETLWGRTEARIRTYGTSVTFLDHRMFVNELLIEPLAAVERRVRALAEQHSEVAEWLAELQVTYSFIDRGIRGSRTRSYHAWGLAVDLVPASYEGRQVYWRWSRALHGESWHRIPLDRRWSPPDAVVAAFEREGFVWGGKWARFDAIHFEYRPEILDYNRRVEALRP